jgi:hypothetical protein
MSFPKIFVKFFSPECSHDLQQLSGFLFQDFSWRRRCRRSVCGRERVMVKGWYSGLQVSNTRRLSL